MTSTAFANFLKAKFIYRKQSFIHQAAIENPDGKQFGEECRSIPDCLRLIRIERTRLDPGGRRLP